QAHLGRHPRAAPPDHPECPSGDEPAGDRAPGEGDAPMSPNPVLAPEHDGTPPVSLLRGETSGAEPLAPRDPRAPFVLTPPVLPLERRTRGWDIPLAVIALALSLAGAALVWAATRETSGQSFLWRHLLNLAIGAGLMVGAARLDARLLRLF